MQNISVGALVKNCGMGAATASCMCLLHCRPKIVDGRIQKFVAEQALLEQPFIKDTTKTVATVIKEAVANVGEKISIRRFERCAQLVLAAMHVVPVVSPY